MTTTKKLLIVYDNFGSGHRVTANIIENIVNQARPDILIKKVTGASFANSPSFNFLVKAQNLLLKSNWVRLANFIVQKSTRYFSLPFLDISLYKKIYHFLEKEKPDMIIATVGGFSKALGCYAEIKKIPFFIFVTNILPSNIDDLHPYAHHIVFFEESKLVGQSFDPNLTYFKQQILPQDNWQKHISYLLKYYADIYLKRIPIFHTTAKDGRKNNFIFSTIGLFLGEKHFSPINQKDIYDQLGINPSIPTILIASGSGGGKIIKKAVLALTKSKIKANILAICGEDSKTLDSLTSFAQQKNPNLKPFGFINNMNEILAIANVAIIRASANTLLECLIHKTPVLFPLPIISNDAGCQKLIEDHNLGKTFRSSTQMLSTLAEMIENNNLYKKNIEEFSKIYTPSYPELAKKITELITNKI